MKEIKQNRWLILIGALGLFVLAACSTSEEAGADPGAESGEVQSEDSGSENDQDDAFRLGEAELPASMQLILGIFQLEGTEIAIDADLAGEMLPLWKAYRSLSDSDTAAQAELAAVIDQIQGLMTADQIEAISSMKLTPEDMQSTLEGLGIEFGRPEGFGEEDFQFPPGGFQGGPGGPGGGPAGPGGGFGGQGNFDPEAAATARAEAGFEGRGGRAGLFLLDPLIELLEERAGMGGA